MLNDPLELLMGRYRREILGTMVFRPGQDFRVRELQRLTGIPVGSLSRELGLLVGGGLLKRRQRAGRIAYSVNLHCAVLPELMALFAASYGLPPSTVNRVADVAAVHETAEPRLKYSQPALARACRRYGVRRLALFGSVARGDSNTDSDIDLLVQFDAKAAVGMRALASLKQELTDIFQQRRIDLVTAGSLENPYRRKSIIKDMEVLYEEREEGRGVSLGYAAGLPRDS